MWDMVNNSDMPGCWVDCAHPVSPPSMPGEKDLFDLLVVFISCSIFGALHFITWFFDMPSTVELWLWRCASITLTAIPCFFTIFFIVNYFIQPSPYLFMVMSAVSYILLPLHPAIRFIVVIDSIYLRRNLQDTALLAFQLGGHFP